jgi:OmpA-OmpF porin, OOP family
MKKFLLGATAAVAAATGATPAFAADADTGTYIGISAGWMNLRSIDYVSAPDFGRVSSNSGFDLAGTVGHDFGLIRAEGEVSYKHAGADAVDGVFGNVPLAGRSNALSAMGNALLDVNVAPRFALSAGGGIGLASVSPHYSGAGLTTGGSATKFAWQLLAQARFAVSQRVDLGVGYRYFNVNDIRSEGSGIAAEGNWRSHSILASLTFNFR